MSTLLESRLTQEQRDAAAIWDLRDAWADLGVQVVDIEPEFITLPMPLETLELEP